MTGPANATPPAPRKLKPRPFQPWLVRCPFCRRGFDMTDTHQAEEWYYGHDCEAP